MSQLDDSPPVHTVPATDAAGTASLLTRIRATFFSPSRLPSLAAPALPWLDVLLISTAIAILAVMTVPDQVFLEPMQEAVTRRGDPVEITSSPDVIARWGRGMGMLATLATHPAVALCLAGALTAVFSILYRGPAGYREYLSVASHGLLIPAAGTVLSAILRLGFGISATPEVGSSADPDALSIVLGIDPFVIWMLVAIAFAVHALDARRSRWRTAILLVASYIVLTASGRILLDRFAPPELAIQEHSSRWVSQV